MCSWGTTRREMQGLGGQLSRILTPDPELEHYFQRYKLTITFLGTQQASLVSFEVVIKFFLSLHNLLSPPHIVQQSAAEGLTQDISGPGSSPSSDRGNTVNYPRSPSWIWVILQSSCRSCAAVAEHSRIPGTNVHTNKAEYSLLGRGRLGYLSLSV